MWNKDHEEIKETLQLIYNIDIREEWREMGISMPISRLPNYLDLIRRLLRSDTSRWNRPLRIGAVLAFSNPWPISFLDDIAATIHIPTESEDGYESNTYVEDAMVKILKQVLAWKENVKAAFAYQKANQPFATQEHVRFANSMGAVITHTRTVLTRVHDDFRVKLMFDLGSHVLDLRQSAKFIPDTLYTITMSQRKDSFLFEDVRGESLITEVPTNPHVGGGSGGQACLGGYNYGIAASMQAGLIGQALKQLWDYHTSVDARDDWGRNIERAPSVHYVNTDTGRKPYMAEDFGVDGILTPRDLPAGEHYYYRGREMLNQRDYVKCAQTGKVIKRDQAVRVVKYLSPEAVRRPNFDTLALVSSNGHDAAKLDQAKEAAWAKHRKQRMPHIIDEAHAFEERVTAKVSYKGARVLNGRLDECFL